MSEPVREFDDWKEKRVLSMMEYLRLKNDNLLDPYGIYVIAGEEDRNWKMPFWERIKKFIGRK